VTTMAILLVAILLLNSYPDPELDLAGGYLGAYFVVSQLAFLCLVFAFAGRLELCTHRTQATFQARHTR